jgi:hypothetical protein
MLMEFFRDVGECPFFRIDLLLGVKTKNVYQRCGGVGLLLLWRKPPVMVVGWFGLRRLLGGDRTLLASTCPQELFYILDGKCVRTLNLDTANLSNRHCGHRRLWILLVLDLGLLGWLLLLRSLPLGLGRCLRLGLRRAFR